MNLEEAKKIITCGGEGLNIDSKVRHAVEFCVDELNRGTLRVSEYNQKEGKWILNGFLKQAILLYFQIQDSRLLKSSKSQDVSVFWDKIPLKTCTWSESAFKASGFRLVPGAVIRYGAFIGFSAVIMPSFINIGAYVGCGTMIDSWVTVGSCAQIGNNCHISDGVTIGGVLEPIQSYPVIVEDGCFIGARSSITEGVRVCKGSVIASGVSLSASTKIVDRETGVVTYGCIPPYSVVVPGSIAANDSKPYISTCCALIIKHVDEKTRTKTSINEILRS
ncbi:MAG: 2,3,4,5-tetrahydropyridine-2,6-dicarboxylate N-succinyltransferase [Holosporales bacterium]|jgi:2,3,4,5-tetrahydropyridine-2-carboxylate N-succinyltransferase|nr:2,3,4,5-tetrahydropyridine-2,6-dicarboxylate N-succinyltransferase [Holosporales bacterium]